ncbi:MAG TPA: metallophosphoesterase family protein [Micromonosporaceae bacterium]|jgi:putative phosphoesterase
MRYPYDIAQHGDRPTAGSDQPVRRISVGSAAFVSDIHANTYAFEAVLAELASEPVDALILNGDITWGSFPAQTVDLIRAAQDRFEHTVLIRGNGDRALLELADGAREPRRPREVWMLAAHRRSDVELLHTVMFQVEVEIAGLGVIRACHGSPRADIETITQRTAIERLAEATAGVDADVLLTGHTHLQFDRPVTELPRIWRSVNPGSAGIPYGGAVPGAYWLRVDGNRFEFRVTGYDLDTYIESMLSTDDPVAEAIAEVLRRPPTADEIIEDSEQRIFAD